MHERKSGQSSLVEAHFGVVYIVNNESHQTQGDDPDDACHDRNSQHATVILITT